LLVKPSLSDFLGILPGISFVMQRKLDYSASDLATAILNFACRAIRYAVGRCLILSGFLDNFSIAVENSLLTVA
jgi:hypothetical protein